MDQIDMKYFKSFAFIGYQTVMEKKYDWHFSIWKNHFCGVISCVGFLDEMYFTKKILRFQDESYTSF